MKELLALRISHHLLKRKSKPRQRFIGDGISWCFFSQSLVLIRTSWQVLISLGEDDGPLLLWPPVLDVRAQQGARKLENVFLNMNKFESNF